MKNIPRICHFIWTKGSPLSWMQLLSVVSFRRYNPDWKIILHMTKQTPQELGANTYVPDYIGRDFFPMIGGLAEIREIDLEVTDIGTDKYGILVSDILRMRILHETGGVYSDFDTLWLRPMSDFKYIRCLGDTSDFETTVCFYDFVKGHHNASNIISVPGCGFLQSIIQEQNKIKAPYEDYQVFNSSLLGRIYPDLNSITNRFPQVMAIDYKTFYPYSTFEMEQLFLMVNMVPIEDNAVMAIHWFNGNRLSKLYVNNEQQWDCSMTRILKTEGYL